MSPEDSEPPEASCPECGFALSGRVSTGHEDQLFDCVYDEAMALDGSGQILEAVDGIARLLETVGGEAARRRVKRDEWSVIEYACHVRDVLLIQRERVLRARRGFGDELLPMGRDARVEHDGYLDQDTTDVAVQLRQAAKLFVNVLDRLAVGDWDLTINYLFPDPSPRSVRWVAVHTGHEAVHHLHDIERLHSSDAQP